MSRITKVTITVKVDYEYDLDELNTIERYVEDSVVQNFADNESDENLLGRAGVVLEFVKAKIPQGAVAALKVGDRLRARVVDGDVDRLVEVFTAPPVTPSCAKHCACHGGGPFQCCRCGAQFVIVEEG